MLKIKTKFRLVIAAYMFLPLSGIMLFAYDTPMYDTPAFQGALGVGVAAAIFLAFCTPYLLSLKWVFMSQLARISSAISRIKKGNYTYFSLPNEPSETGDENEVVALMRDMNWMIRQIEYREAELEDRVQMRTCELEMANAELVRARDAANASALAKSQFLATMSHEIRTPMNAIIGMSDLALKANRDPAQSEHLTVINTASKSLLKIINDILDFSKMEAGKLVPEAIPIRLRDILKGAADLFKGQVRESAVKFFLDISSDVPETVTGDPLRLHQVLVNLLSNAFKFTEQGEVCLAARPEADAADHIRFSVRDTGVGMDEAAQKELFTPFTQADGSTTRKFGGTGLGLAISRKIICLMGSDICLESCPDQGSCFTFVLKMPPCEPSLEMAAPLTSDVLSPSGVLQDKSETALDREREELSAEATNEIMTEAPKEKRLDPRLPEMMVELASLLGQHSLSAKTLSKQIAQTLTGTPWEKDAFVLRTQTDRFDFTSAKKTVEQLNAALASQQSIADSKP